jgi:acyl dehydratase
MSEIDLSLVGSLSAPFVVEVERGAIRRFAEAVGDPSPLYRDAAAARDAGFDDIPAPPTFPTAFRPEEEPAWTRDLDRRRILAGETSFTYERPVVAGMRLECRVRFVAVDVKKSTRGDMQAIRQQIEARLLDANGKAGDLVVTCGRVTLYRQPRSELSSS